MICIAVCSERIHRTEIQKACEYSKRNILFLCFQAERHKQIPNFYKYRCIQRSDLHLELQRAATEAARELRSHDLRQPGADRGQPTGGGHHPGVTCHHPASRAPT